jgi:hypothetical protein
MRKHTVRIVAFAVLLGASGRAASVMAGPGMKRNIVGVLAGVERHSPPTLQVTTARGHEARQVRTDAKTEYVKWITHKPGPEDKRADAAALVEGRCVDVEPRTGNPGSAKIVRISEEPAGSAFDPCKERR